MKRWLNTSSENWLRAYTHTDTAHCDDGHDDAAQILPKKLIENHFCSSVEIMSLLLHWQFRVSIKYARNLDFYFFRLFFSCILRAKSTHSFMQLNDLFSTKFSLFAVFGSIIFKWMACTSESAVLIAHKHLWSIAKVN